MKTFFDHLNQIVKFKEKNYWNNLTDADKSTWNTYMLNRYLSMNFNFIELVNLFQRFNHNLSNYLCYIVYVNIIPKSNLFIKYIKADKDNKNNELIKYISLYYECSSKEAKEYLEILNIENIKNILDQFGLEEKEIKKIINRR